VVERECSSLSAAFASTCKRLVRASLSGLPLDRDGPSLLKEKKEGFGGLGRRYSTGP